MTWSGDMSRHEVSESLIERSLEIQSQIDRAEKCIDDMDIKGLFNLGMIDRRVYQNWMRAEQNEQDLVDTHGDAFDPSFRHYYNAMEKADKNIKRLQKEVDDLVGKSRSTLRQASRVASAYMNKTSSHQPGRRMNDDIFTDMDGRPVKVNSLDDVVHVPSGFEGFPYEMSGYGSDLMVLISDEYGEEKLFPAIEVRKVRDLKKLRSFKDRYRNVGKVGDKVVLTPKGGSGLRKDVVGVVEMIFTEGNDPEVMIKLRSSPTEFPAKHLTMYDKYVEFYGQPKKASKTEGSGAENARYLNSISPAKKAKILKHIADHYGVSVREIEEELVDQDAEKLFEYAASNNAMAMEIYRGMGRMATSKTAASGNYGFTKAVQKDVEVALRKLEKKVNSLARLVENKHPEAGAYFSTRCQGSNCNASKALGGACLLNQKPKRMLAGPLGFKPNCARASHKAITDLILYSGEVAHSLHSKTRNHVPYLETHAKKKRCPLTRLLLENYPVEIL